MEKNYEIRNNTLFVRINSNIYNKEVIIQTTYVLLEKYYFLIDIEGDYFVVSIKFKDEIKGGDSIESQFEKTAYEFFDELIESQSYLDQLKRTSKTREIILENALLNQNTFDDVDLDVDSVDENK